MWVIRGKSTSLDGEEPGVFVLEIRGVGTAVGGVSPHLRVVFLVQVGMAVVGSPRSCVGSAMPAWSRAGCLALLVGAGSRAGIIPG